MPSFEQMLRDMGHAVPLADDIQRLRDQIAAEIEQFADDHSDVSDAYRHAAMIAKGIPGA